MTRIRFEDLPSTNTPRNSENLNKLNNVVISSTEPTTGEEVWVQKGKNLFDKNKALIGYEINGSDGTVSVNASYYVSDYIPIKPNTNYYLTKIVNGTSNCFYDVNRNFISTIRKDNGVITTPNNSNVYYMRFNGPISDLDNVQAEQNSTATSYEAYIDKKIYTKNDNGVYEKFYDESEVGKEVYSTTEQVIGTWIDGKPLYRKVFTVTLGNNAFTITNITLSITNGANAHINDSSYINKEGYNYPVNNTRLHSDSAIYANAQSWFRINDAGTLLQYDVASLYLGGTATIIIEYTKTTD